VKAIPPLARKFFIINLAATLENMTTPPSILKVLASGSFFSRGQKVLGFKFAALFCQLSLSMLGRQQQLILLVEKDQQVLQMGKTSHLQR
jgi:hypothetical protein